MTSTSLAEQLEKLRVPQATIYKEDSKRASLLFDPKEAASKDRETFYEIGLSGLKELTALYEGFRLYEDTLFSQSSKDFERAVQTKEVNQNLDQTIEKFLLQLSPYLLLQSAHKALEWLVNRYHIHQYNEDAVMALILPYHETKIFVRFIQLMDLKSSKRWVWLRPLQKNGVPLSKQILYNHCVSNTDTLQFIARTALKHVQEFGERALQLNTVFAFFCSTVIGTVNSTKKITEAMINALLPTVMKALESPVVDFRTSAYVILGFLVTKAKIKQATLNILVDRLMTTEFEMSFDMALLINLIFANQSHLTIISENVLRDMSVNIMNTLCIHLKKFVEQGISVQAFVLAFLSSVLPIIQKDSEDFRGFYQLPEILIDHVDFKNEQPEKIIKCILDTLQQQSENHIPEGDESDLELIDEDEFSIKILQWYTSLLKNLEVKYPEAFDKVIKSEMSSESKTNAKKRKQLSKVLGFKPEVAHRVSGGYLFENLNNVNAEVRIEAVKYIAKEFQALKKENSEFVKDSIISRLNDDDVKVVDAALAIPSSCLNEVLNSAEITSTFVKILSKTSKKWREVIKKAIEKFCALECLPVNQETVLALLPYLFPRDKSSVNLTMHILNSTWGKKFELTKNVNIPDSCRDNPEVIRQKMFKTLFSDKTLDLSSILDYLQLDKSNTLDICNYMLLKSCTLKTGSVEDITEILNLLLESVEDRIIVQSSEGHDEFNHNIISEYFMTAKQNKILFEVMHFIFSAIIENLNIANIAKPWCNVCENPETILARRLYEICITGCAIPSYSSKYAKLLKKLLAQLFVTPKEKFDFIASIACGHILYATDPEILISPELQIRSMKLLCDFLTAQEDHWVFDSDVTILMILFNLNNPVEAVRKIVFNFIKLLLRNTPDKNLVYMQLAQQLVAHKQELLLDHEQIKPVLNTILIRQTPGLKKFRMDCFVRFQDILSGDAPAHIKSSFVMILSCFQNAKTFTHIVPALKNIEETLVQTGPDHKLILNIYESNLLKTVYSHVNAATVTTFALEDVWKSISTGLKEYRECVLEDDQTSTSPCVLILNEIDDEVFKKVPEDRREELVYLITAAGAFSRNPSISSVASKVMKKIHINFADFKPILEKMLNAVDPSAKETKKKKSSSAVLMLSYELTETADWRLGVTLLEYVQSKKKMSVDNSFVIILFQLLNKCLRFEEQSYVEYTKQLILSSLWYFCKKFVDDKDKDQLKSLKSIFDVELIIQCIRGSRNPQTHHHALILLSHAAYMIPEQVLHHTMEIFTFMGSSVLSYDDAYSFQIITKIIETLIPILVKLDKDISEYSEKELKMLQDRVVPVLRIFSDVVLHVPEHRRLPLYKKLIESLGPSQFLWVFLALLLETYIAHFKDPKKKDKSRNRTLADQESPVTQLDFGQNLLLEFAPEIGLENFVKLILYVKSLPMQKDENSMDSDVDHRDIFSINGHNALQLRHYKYVIITFMSTCLSSSRFIQHCSQSTDVKTMENLHKSFIINILTFIQSISKVSDEKTAKYWRVMLHHSYDLLDHTNSLLSAPMFLSVIRGLMGHTLVTVRRKSMELLNNKIQFSPEMFETVDKELICSLLSPLLDIVQTIEENDQELEEIAAQELELNQQTALLSLKLLARMLAAQNPEAFKPVLERVTDYTCNPNIGGNVMASVVLCLAELCSNLKAHALVSLRKFMPALIKVMKKQRKSETPELVLLSTVTAISKIVESLPLFLSPYLQKILYEYSILLAKWKTYDQECSKVSAIVTKLSHIKKKVACSIPPRVLIPVAKETYQLLLEKENFNAIGPVMSVLADSFANVTTADFTALQQDLTALFLSALQLRSDAVEKNIDLDIIDRAEDEIVNALVSLVLKLSETSFRPFYFKIYDWAIRTNVDGHKDRVITFYRLSAAIAGKLKGLFVLFSGHFIKNAADLLDSCNTSKTEQLYFDSQDKCIILIDYIIKTLHLVFSYDSQNFVNKDRFETLMQPVVDQLENTLGGIQSLKTRATESLIPCISQFAVATADDSLWKLLNYQILLKIRHNDAEIRLTALDCLVAMATQLGTSWLPLLAESVPFLAELLEDGDNRIESATKEAIRKLEVILGEPLEKYF